MAAFSVYSLGLFMGIDYVFLLVAVTERRFILDEERNALGQHETGEGREARTGQRVGKRSEARDEQA